MLLGLFLVALLLCTPVHGDFWSPVVTDSEMLCRRAKRLEGRMSAICSNKRAALRASIKAGFDRGIQECQSQFQTRHWNCTFEKKSIRKVLLRDTRETGFVNAITAAGVTYNVAKVCSMGNISQCGCDNRVTKGSNKNSNRHRHHERTDWKWGGCDDNVAFGYKKSKAFLDYPYRKRSDMKTLLRLHNNEAGRLAVICRKKCVCHGLSGSCGLKTCWMRLPDFAEVGRRLKERFDGATKVIPGNDGRTFLPESTDVKVPTKKDLVYSEDSTNFCRYNRSTGSLGTLGRVCNATNPGVGGCDILCCGRGYDTRLVHETIDCHCKFKYCCSVDCEKCTRNRTIHTCR